MLLLLLCVTLRSHSSQGLWDHKLSNKGESCPTKEIQLSVQLSVQLQSIMNESGKSFLRLVGIQKLADVFRPERQIISVCISCRLGHWAAQQDMRLISHHMLITFSAYPLVERYTIKAGSSSWHRCIGNHEIHPRGPHTLRQLPRDVCRLYTQPWRKVHVPVVYCRASVRTFVCIWVPTSV